MTAKKYKGKMLEEPAGWGICPRWAPFHCTDMNEASDGEYVLYEDHVTRIRELEAKLNYAVREWNRLDNASDVRVRNGHSKPWTIEDKMQELDDYRPEAWGKEER